MRSSTARAGRCRPVALAVSLTMLSAATFAACGEDQDRSEGRYCTEVGDHILALNNPPVATQTDVDAMLDEWRTVAAAAPLAVQPEWEALLANVERAATLDPNDQEAVQALADQARQTQPAADRVISYTQNICGVTIGKVKPVAPTTTTVAAATTTT